MKSFFGSLIASNNPSHISSQPTIQSQTNSTKPPKEVISLGVKPSRHHCQWLQAVSILKFDLEKGSVIEHIYPPVVDVLHEREEKDLTSLAFPESNSLQQGDGTLYYTFRLRHYSPLPLNN